MFRATSEIAVAITVRSLLLNPASEASCRPSSLAVRMSAPEFIGTRTSLFTSVTKLGSLIQQGQPFLEVQRRLHFAQCEP